MAFSLDQVVSSKTLYRPQRILLYGVQGIGKTTAACTFKDPIVLRTEDGTCAMDCPTFPEQATCFEHVEEAVKALHGEHPYRTLIVDSLDWLEPLVWNRVCRGHLDDSGQPLASIEALGYGKGYVEADSFWRYIQGGFDSLRLNKGMQIVLIAHSEIKTFRPPDMDEYDRYQPKLHKRAFALWQEWCDNVLFVNYRTILKARDEKGKEFRAEGRGDRVVFTQERPAFLAKNRWNLPSEIAVGSDRTWRPVHDALRAAIGESYPYPFSEEGEK